MPRRDALRNREKLIAAAHEVFAARGIDATLDDIAAHAGVGTGTAYRNFADKFEIAGEVLEHATQLIADDARDALAVDDPWDGLVLFFQRVAARTAANRGLYQALAGQGRAADKIRIWPDIVAGVTQLFARAKKAGVIRKDVQAEDAVAIFAMLGQLDDWPRYLALVLDGLRATDRPKLPGKPKVFATLDDVINYG